MARRRGFFAEIQHQQQLAARRQAQQERAAVREYNQAVLARERAANARRRAVDAERRATAAEQARLEKQAAAAYVAEREAEAAEITARAQAQQQEIETLLAATLEIDDWVDLTHLHQVFDPPPFDAGQLAVRTPAPTYSPLPPQPRFTPPARPSGLSGRLGGQRKYETQLAEAHSEYSNRLAGWDSSLEKICASNAAIRDRWRRDEADRIARLSRAAREHEAQLRVQKDRIRKTNVELDQLITDLASGVGSAVEQYVAIVLANSTYPESFDVDYEHEFIVEDRELSVIVLVPRPDDFPSIRSVRYVKAKDELSTTRLSATELKRRYNSAVYQTALRTPHEVFEADRKKIVDAISLTVSVDAVDPATGRDRRVPLVQLAVDRSGFLAIDLSRVEPLETLRHLAAAVSKNPYALTPLAGQGVRG